MQRIIFFDGLCSLCNRFISYVFYNDKKKYFKYASLQSKTASQMLTKQDLSLDSIVYFEDGKIYKKSSAVLRIMFHLDGLWSFFSVLASTIPLPIRDYIYTKIAINRYKIFGQLNSCRIPTAEESRSFLD